MFHETKISLHDFCLYCHDEDIIGIYHDKIYQRIQSVNKDVNKYF